MGEGSTIIVITCGDQRVEVPVTVKFPSANIPCTALSADPMEELTAVGETQQLTVTPTPGDTTDTITYASNDTTIVTVNETGLVTVVGEGSTVIVITCGSQQTNVPVTVKAPSVPCTGLTADSKVELTTTDQPWQLTVNVSPADTTDTVTYASNDPAVVTVNETGLVTPVGEGSTVIVITCGGQQTNVPVTVKTPSVPCTGVTAGPIAEFTAAGQTQALSVTVNPPDTTDTITYASGDPAVVTVNENGLVTAVGEGTASIVISCGGQQATVTAVVDLPDPQPDPQPEPQPEPPAEPNSPAGSGAAIEPKEVIELSTEQTTVSTVELAAAGQTKQLKVTLSPTDNPDTLTFTSNDPAVVTVDGSGLITVVGEGSTAVVITCGEKRIEVPIVVKFQ